jgi:hypothetical protein
MVLTMRLRYVRAVVDGFTHYFDASVVTAPLPSGIEVGAAHFDAAAASDREAKKTAKYRQTTAVNVNNSSFTPFVLETHGRLGKQATDISRKLSRDRDAGTHHDRHEDDEVPLFGTRERNVKLLGWGTLLSVSLQCSHVEIMDAYYHWMTTHLKRGTNRRRRALRSQVVAGTQNNGACLVRVIWGLIPDSLLGSLSSTVVFICILKVD